MTLYTSTTGLQLQSPALPILDLIARSAFPSNPFTPQTQNWKLWERLRQGPTTNVEIVRDLNTLNSTGRISEVRQALSGTGWTVDTKWVRRGLYEYSVRRAG